MTGTERSSVLGGRREEKAHFECAAVERSMPVWQPLGMTDHRESNDVCTVPVGTQYTDKGISVTSHRSSGI